MSADTDRPIAQRFHEAYERLAPSFGYETHKESAVPWDQVPEQNRALMEAVVSEVVGPLAARLDTAIRWLEKIADADEMVFAAHLRKAASDALAAVAVPEAQRETLAEPAREALILLDRWHSDLCIRPVRLGDVRARLRAALAAVEPPEEET